MSGIFCEYCIHHFENCREGVDDSGTCRDFAFDPAFGRRSVDEISRIEQENNRLTEESADLLALKRIVRDYHYNHLDYLTFIQRSGKYIVENPVRESGVPVPDHLPMLADPAERIDYPSEMFGKVLKIMGTRQDAMELLQVYFTEDCERLTDKMELLRRCRDQYIVLLDADNRLRNYEIENRLDEVRKDCLHRIRALCPFNGFNSLDGDGTWNGYKDGDVVPRGDEVDDG